MFRFLKTDLKILLMKLWQIAIKGGIGIILNLNKNFSCT
jgi:hypothetical protein